MRPWVIVAIVVGVVVGAFLMRRLQTFLHKNWGRASLRLQIVSGVVGLGAIALSAADVISNEAGALTVIGLIVVLAVGGWLRYRSSPRLQRLEALDRQIDKLLDTNPDAVDQLISDAVDQDDAELEQLRAAAPQDRRAALEFQRRIEERLRATGRTAATVRRMERGPKPISPAGSIVMMNIQQKLEADLAWIQEILAGPPSTGGR